MKITDTRICINCEEVFEDGPATCPACASRTTILLAQWVPPIGTSSKKLETIKIMMASAGISCSDEKSSLIEEAS
jgi:hypothetical protein